MSAPGSWLSSSLLMSLVIRGVGHTHPSPAPSLSSQCRWFPVFLRFCTKAGEEVVSSELWASIPAAIQAWGLSPASSKRSPRGRELTLRVTCFLFLPAGTTKGRGQRAVGLLRRQGTSTYKATVPVPLQGQPKEASGSFLQSWVGEDTEVQQSSLGNRCRQGRDALA